MRIKVMMALLFLALSPGCDSSEQGGNDVATTAKTLNDPKLTLALRAYDARNYATVVEHAVPVAERGNLVAQYLLGSAYANAEGQLKDLALADAWLTRSAEQGFIPAMRDLGHLNLLYIPVPDWEQAIDWYGKAAARGDTEAQQALGVLHVNAIEDVGTAYKWLLLAAAAADDESFKLSRALLDKLAGQLSPAQRAEADRAARNWRPVRTDLAAAAASLSAMSVLAALRPESSESTLSKLEHHMASNPQLRFGQLVGDILGLDAVFGALLCPTAGLIGKATWQTQLRVQASQAQAAPSS